MPEPEPSPRWWPRWPNPRVRRLAVAGVLLLGWVAVAVPVGALTFDRSSRTTVLAGHEAQIRPTFDGWATVDLGPVLPSLRYPSGSRIGADIALGRTSLGSYEELVDRYAFLASQPESQIAKVRGALVEMALAAALTGALAGLAVPATWVLVGPRRRRELARSRRALTAIGVTGALAVTGLTAVATRPWDDEADRLTDTRWRPVAEALPDVPIPAQARDLQVDAGLLTQGTERLVASALDSYRKSSAFYAEAAAAAESLPLREPSEDETVGVLVSDRHDNIGMDPVARAVADAAGATFLMSAGDDTSTGSSWEAFSLESLDEAFADFEHRYFVAGNHDHGAYVPEQAERLGFTRLDGEVVEGPDGIRLLGLDDPRSSGLGNWRDETGLSFGDVAERLADIACESSERVTTLLVHDRNLGGPALERGCVDLVVAGHLHEVQGPLRVEGEGGEVGWTYTTGTTGGAAYAVALGSKPRREATISLVTYRDGRPVGIQWVRLTPLGELEAGPWTELKR
ncbi:metallophosphoesterase family protein [Nocardioides caldifontis]|uniref:metallophosphoesterase family protein n=1 Tax=Nocardioides caldifontis TaxID=2588938 RepID=UPI001EF0B517|nr:metallophosphoesterase [Nocardioides caldifontis]